MEAPARQQLKAWMQAAKALSKNILERRDGELIDVQAILAADRADLEGRDEWVTGRN